MQLGPLHFLNFAPGTRRFPTANEAIASLSRIVTAFSPSCQGGLVRIQQFPRASLTNIARAVDMIQKICIGMRFLRSIHIGDQNHPVFSIGPHIASPAMCPNKVLCLMQNTKGILDRDSFRSLFNLFSHRFLIFFKNDLQTILLRILTKLLHCHSQCLRNLRRNVQKLQAFILPVLVQRNMTGIHPA